MPDEKEFVEELTLKQQEVRVHEASLSVEERVRLQDTLAATIRRLVELGDIVRHKGLLILGEAETLAPDAGDDDLCWMLMMVLDGFDPSLLYEYCWKRYKESGYTGAAALRYLLLMTGCAMIQYVVRPADIEEALLAMVPAPVKARYEKKE